jgi:hypothetical protein|tara:strand:- start:5141 stop:5815 length:675 start_codon:yes stop_codon:yes gene_type:complete
MLSVAKVYKAQLQVILMTMLLMGCASARIQQSRTATTGMTTEESLVILSRTSYNERETEESFTDCLSDALSGGRTPIRLMSEAEFKDQLYPWFEPRTAPDSSDDLARLFAQPGVQQRIDENNVRYIAWIDGDTITTDRGGSFSCTVSTVGGGCFGVTYWEEDASYEAAIWDLQNLTTAGEISAYASGTSYIAGLVLPIPIMARPGNAACKALALQLKEFLQAEG